jgi:hypothetical protein
MNARFSGILLFLLIDCASAAGPTPAATAYPVVTSKSQYDALKVGDLYLKEGKLYKKRFLAASASPDAPEYEVIETQDGYNGIPYGASYWYKGKIYTKSSSETPPAPLVSGPAPPPAKPNTDRGTTAATSSFPVVTSKEQFDALKVGDWFRNQGYLLKKGYRSASLDAPEYRMVLTQDDYNSVAEGESYWYADQLYVKSQSKRPPAPLVSQPVPSRASTSNWMQQPVVKLVLMFVAGALVVGGIWDLMHKLKARYKSPAASSGAAPKKPVADPPPLRRPPAKKESSPPRADTEVRVTSLQQAYEILGVPYGQISMAKTAYRELLSQYHPDRVAHLGKAFRDLAAIETLKINLAMQFINANAKH